MAGTVSFKVYLSSEEESSKEVRRFGVEADAVTNFLYLREKLQTIFPSLRGKHFTVSWKDSDGDDVVISSDEELQIALAETASSNIRKLFVVLHSEYPSRTNGAGEPSESGPIHDGIICDGCDKQIRGFRYKCVQCVDYDLCVECESRGMHPEHCMIRLSEPLLWKPHYGRRLATQVNRFVKKAQCYTAKDDETKQCPFKAGKHHGKHRHNQDAPSWMDTFATYLDELANFPGECPMKETAKEATEEIPSAASAENKAAPPPRETNDKCPVEQIRLLTNMGLAVGENLLSQFLDPLVNMHAKNDKPTTTETPSPSASSYSSSLAAAHAAAKKEQEVPQNSKESTPTPKFPGEGKKLGESSGDEAATPLLNQELPADTPKRVSFESEGWTLLNQSDSPTPSMTSPAASSTGAIPKQVQPSAPTEAPTNSIYPKLPETPPKKPVEEVPIVYHPNPTIQKSVESMIQMGFSNEGGWLTNLLISKSGDIAAALDALSPVRN